MTALFEPIRCYNVTVACPELTGDPAADFRTLLAFKMPWDALEAAHQADWLHAVTAAFQQAFPKAKVPDDPDSRLLKMATRLDRALGAGGYDRLKAEHRKLGEAVASQIMGAIQAVKVRLGELAEGLPIVPGTEWTKAETVSMDAYRQSGPGYSQLWADLIAAGYRAAGLEARVIPWGSLTTSAMGLDVEVKASAETIAIAKMSGRATLPLRELVRLCWKRGLQPRVFFRGLSYDYEARNGLDCFGNDTREKGR